MANIITTKEVFDFMGTEQGQRDKHNAAISNLTELKQEELTIRLRRSLVSVDFSSQVFFNGRNCSISKEKLYLKGAFRDTYSISSITESGIALTASTAYADGNDYFYHANKGIIEKINNYWSIEPLAIVISGSYGYLNSSNETRENIKLILIEMVAAASGLWTTQYLSSEGNITSTKYTVTKVTENKIKGHINRGDLF